MDRSIGERGLGETARAQLEAARKDPRLDRDHRAHFADFWDAMDEAERVRFLGMWGLEELRQSVEREERRLGVSRHDSNLSADNTATLQAAWERAELADAEIANGHPHLNAQALISMNSALDALVERLAPSMREIAIKGFVEQMMKTVEQKEPEAASKIAEDQREALAEAAENVLDDMLPSLRRPKGNGAKRYERVLERAGLGAPSDRSIPEDLDQALAELGALRDVLVHRAGRVDRKALEQVPSLPYGEGDFVRISREDYRRYSAAVRCYGAEIAYRPIRNWPEVTDEKNGPNLTGWRNYCIVNA